MSDKSAMPVSKALDFSDEWAKGATFYPGAEGWRVVCATLAAEVRRLREENKRLTGELVKTGCSDFFCEKAKQVCKDCPAHLPNTIRKDAYNFFKEIPF